MTIIKNDVAYVIKRIHHIWEDRPGKKTLQKIIFLLQQKGFNFGYEYGLHFYGPYSRALDIQTTFLGADGIIEFDYSGYSHLMSVNEDNFSVQPDVIPEEQWVKIDEVIRRFQNHTASDLELLTTAIYAYDHLENKSKDNVVSGVRKIKGEKYTEEQIFDALEQFRYFNMRLVD